MTQNHILVAPQCWYEGVCHVVRQDPFECDINRYFEVVNYLQNLKPSDFKLLQCPRSNDADVSCLEEQLVPLLRCCTELKAFESFKIANPWCHCVGHVVVT